MIIDAVSYMIEKLQRISLEQTRNQESTRLNNNGVWKLWRPEGNQNNLCLKIPSCDYSAAEISMACVDSSQLDVRRMKGASCEKHLDYSAPLLSVRRLNEYAATNGRTIAASQRPYKLSAELSAESLRKPGAVPFMWEQSPGKPKNKEDDEITCSSSRDTSPTGVDPDESHPVDYFDNESRVEHNNNKIVKEDLGSSPEGSFINLLGLEGKGRLTLSQDITKFALPFREGNRMHTDSRAQAATRSHCHSDFEDSMSEVTDTMAPTEPVATTCRVSMDGFEGTEMISQTSREARDFIMSRFLPAAKAIACDSPSNSNRRFVQEPSIALVKGRLSRGPLPLTPRPPRIPVAKQKPEEKLPLPDEEENIVSKKICGLFSLRLRASFLHLSRNPPALFRSRIKKCPPSLSHPGKLGNVIYDDTSSGSDDEEIVIREVQASSHERRAQAKASGTQASISPRNACDFTGRCLSYQHTSEGGETPNSKLAYFDAVSGFSPQASTDRSGSRSVSPYRNNFSPFRESKRFLGLPRQWSDAVAYPDGASSCFETPRASVAGDSYFSRDSSPISRGNMRSSSLNLNNIAGKSLNGLVVGSPAENAVAAQEHVSNGDYIIDASYGSFPQPGNVDLAGSGRTDSFRVPDSASVSNDLRAPELNSGGCSDTLSHEEWPIPEPVGWPLGISGKLLDSPGKASLSKKWIEKESPASALSPPLPKSPSESWLWRTLPLKAQIASPLSNLSVPASMLTKKQLDFSPTPTGRAS